MGKVLGSRKTHMLGDVPLIEKYPIQYNVSRWKKIDGRRIISSTPLNITFRRPRQVDFMAVICSTFDVYFLFQRKEVGEDPTTSFIFK